MGYLHTLLCKLFYDLGLFQHEGIQKQSVKVLFYIRISNSDRPFFRYLELCTAQGLGTFLIKEKKGILG